MSLVNSIALNSHRDVPSYLINENYVNCSTRHERYTNQLHTILTEMQNDLKYVELKTGYSDNGPAWIGFVSYSKSKRTIYFDGKAFQSLSGMGVSGNYYDLDTGDEYWISGIKKDMSDRHASGNGLIQIEKRALSTYLKLIGKDNLPDSKYSITEFDKKPPIDRIHGIENQVINKPNYQDDLYFKNPADLAVDELEHLISELELEEVESKYNKARRSIKKKRLELIAELEKREID